LTKAKGIKLIPLSSDKPSEVEGFPMKIWNIEIYLLDEAGNEKPASCFTKAVYNLHPSFANPVQSEYAVFEGTAVR
jgi:transcription initiation factor IIF auxiliary subunit